MTVEELIKELQKYPLQMEVSIETCDSYSDITYGEGEAELRTGFFKTITTRYGSGFVAKEKKFIESEAIAQVLVIRQ